MKDRLILLVGPSGTGKTTIAKELEKLGYNIIHSYTNRDSREPNEWGHTFLKGWKQNCSFVISPGGIKSFNHRQMIAYFNNYDKDEFYFATYEQYQGKGTSIYIVDTNGANQVKKNVKDAETITIFLMADVACRLYRMADRIENTDVDEVIRQANERLEKDLEIFKTCKCNYVVDANRELEEVVKDVIEIIEGEI